MWGESLLGFRELSDWPLRDARRLLWLAPWRPPVKTILTCIEHRPSKHTDCQAPQWLVRQVQVQVGAWFGVWRTRGAAARASDRVWGALAPASGTLPHIVHHVRISGYDIHIYRYSTRHRTRCRNAISLYTNIVRIFPWISACFLRYRGKYRVARFLGLERPNIGTRYRVRYRRFFIDIVVVDFDIVVCQCFWIWSVLISGYDIEDFSTIS